mmetsp:Transcript_13799/g.39700  ORF Transcript_13799/g.39700 Transcript_13799/m.39700 type:complete len:215 (-) Transcript_13799:899-1543(-)
MVPTFDRRRPIVSRVNRSSSMNMDPRCGSYRPNRSAAMVDLPDPDWPTSATASPEFASNEMSFSTQSSDLGYLNQTFSNRIDAAGRSSAGGSFAASFPRALSNSPNVVYPSSTRKISSNRDRDPLTLPRSPRLADSDPNPIVRKKLYTWNANSVPTCIRPLSTNTPPIASRLRAPMLTANLPAPSTSPWNQAACLAIAYSASQYSWYALPSRSC